MLVKTCDICGKTETETTILRFLIYTGVSYDNGIGLKPDTKVMDICASCLQDAIKILGGRMYEVIKELKLRR